MITKCKHCGKNIQFIKTQKGKLMPCELWSTSPAESGKPVMLDIGYMVNDLDSTAIGFPPHYYRCTFKKRKKTRKESPKKYKQLSLF